MSDRTAVDYARAIAAELPDDWRLDDNTLRAILEGDTCQRHWAGLVSSSHPGAEVSVNTSHHEGMLTISASYPKNYEPYIEGRGRIYRESIKVGMGKSAGQMARDITRRLFDATGYLPRAAECIACRDAHDAGQAKARQVTERLAALMGERTQAQKGRDYGPGASHLVTEQGDRNFTAWPNITGSRVEVSVNQGGTLVDVHIDGVTVEFAERILTQWKDYRAQLDRATGEAS